MARGRQSLFEDLVEVGAKFPWWAGIILAVIGYLLLHPVAVMEIAVSPNAKDIGVSVNKAMFKAAATVGQYGLPAAFLIGALISAFSRRKLNALDSRVAAAGRRDALESMSWREFEQLVGEHFRRRGFTVQENKGGADGGVDLQLGRGDDQYFVQCKQWKARQVGVAPVRELYGVMAAERAAGGYVVTSGIFTDEAKRFAEGREIELIDGEQLFGMISVQAETGKPTVAPHPHPLPARGAREPALDPGSESAVTPSGSEAPACPQCSSPMVLRTARKGNNAGSSFWGCSTFPKCRGTRAA